MNLLDRLLNRDRPLEQALAAYPVATWPHGGRGVDLTPAQRDENLAWFLGGRKERIGALRTFLGDLGVALPPPGDPTLDAGSVSAAFDDLVKRRFTKVAAFETACAPDWRNRAATGIEGGARSVVIDLGAYIGECATHASEPFKWRVGESRYRAANMPMSAGEVVISKMSRIGPPPNRIDLDVIDWSVFAVWDIVRHHRQKAFWKRNHFEHLNHLLANRY